MVKTIRWIFRFFFLIAFVSVLAAGALFLWLANQPAADQWNHDFSGLKRRR